MGKKTKSVIIWAAVILGFAALVLIAAKLDPDGSYLISAVSGTVGIIVAGAAAGRSEKRSERLKSFSGLIGGSFENDLTGRRKLRKAIELRDKDDYRKAVKTLKKLRSRCRTADDRFAVLIILALCYDESGWTDKAIEAYKECISLKNNSTALSNLGYIYKDKKSDPETAEKLYLKAVEANPANPYAYNNLAGLYLSLGKYEAAIEYARKAVELDERMTTALNIIACGLCALGRSEEAEKYALESAEYGYDEQKLRNMMDYYRNLGAEMR